MARQPHPHQIEASSSRNKYQDMGYVGWMGLGGSVFQVRSDNASSNDLLCDILRHFEVVLFIIRRRNSSLFPLQWHPELEIGFGYAPTLLHFWDLKNGKAERLQRAVVECIKDIGK